MQRLWRSLKSRNKLTFIDAVIILIAASLLVYTSILVYAGPAPSQLIISASGDEWIYPLDTDREISIDGLIGTSIIKIDKGQAYFLDSPCKNRTCINSTGLKHTGDWNACLPNGVFIRISGTSGSEDDIDAIVR